MSNHPNEPIARLRSLIQAGLHEENLERVVREMAASLDGEAVPVERHDELIRGIMQQASSLLQKLESGAEVAPSEIEALLQTHFVNMGLFKR